jgi:hypothetical protein
MKAQEIFSNELPGSSSLNAMTVLHGNNFKKKKP